MLLWTPEELATHVCGALNAGDCFCIPGNESGYASVEAMIGNNTDLRRVQSYIHNPHLLDEAKYHPVHTPQTLLDAIKVTKPATASSGGASAAGGGGAATGGGAGGGAGSNVAKQALQASREEYDARRAVAATLASQAAAAVKTQADPPVDST